MFQRIDKPETPPRASRWRTIVSRGTMLLVGVALLYAGVRGLMGLVELACAGETHWTYRTYGGRLRFNWYLLLVWAGMIVLAGFGAFTVVAASLSRAAMQRLFERWYRPPITNGDVGSDRFEARDFRRSRFGSDWWWWS